MDPDQVIAGHGPDQVMIRSCPARRSWFASSATSLPLSDEGLPIEGWLGQGLGGTTCVTAGHTNIYIYIHTHIQSRGLISAGELEPEER